MRSSPRSGRCGWTQSGASQGSTPGNSVRPIAGFQVRPPRKRRERRPGRRHGPRANSPRPQDGGAERAVGTRHLPTLRGARRSPPGRSRRGPAAGRLREQARPRSAQRGARSDLGRVLLSPRERRGTPGPRQQVRTAKGRGIRVMPTTAALRGAARTTATMPVPPRTATTGTTAAAAPGTGARRGAEAASQPSGRGQGPVAATDPGGQEPQGEHGPQADPARSSQAADEGVQLQAPAEAEAQEDGGGAPHEDQARMARARGGGAGGTPTRGGVAPRATDGGTGPSGTMTGTTHGPGGTGTTGLPGLAGTGAQTARARSPPTRLRHSSAISPGRNADRGAHRRPSTKPCPPGVPGARVMGKVGARRLPHLQKNGGRQIHGEDEAGQHQH